MMPERKDAESAATSQAIRRFVCRDCEKTVVRTSNSQKICAKCKREQSNRISNAWHKRKTIERGGTTRGDVFQCKCGADVIRGSGAQKLCSDCRAIEKKAYKQAHQRAAHGVVVPLGSFIKCETCPAQIVRNGGLQKYCPECRRQSQLKIDRDIYRKRQGRPTANLGDIISCKKCNRDIVRKGALQKFCTICVVEERTEQARKNQSRRMASSPQLRLNSRIGSAIARSLRGSKAGAHWENLVGYSLKELMLHLERQFLEGMTFENYGDWEVEHILPLAMWNFDGPSHPDFKFAWGLPNIRPWWAEDNNAKRDHRLHLL